MWQQEMTLCSSDSLQILPHHDDDGVKRTTRDAVTVGEEKNPNKN